MLNLRKLSVGTENLEGLRKWHQLCLKRQGAIFHTTRNWPRRADELVDGGALYWIVKGKYVGCQRITGFEPFEIHDDQDKKPYCNIMLDPTIIEVEPWPHRPFQGWRYLEQSDAPPFLDPSSGDSQQFIANLKQLGIDLK
ncbi:MAG: DUF1489 family protein [Alphaproteobacteria bacterium]